MVTQRTFGTLPSGEEVQIYHLENKSGAFAEVLQFGAILVKLCVPDRDGRLTDVVLGYDDLAGYEVNGCFFGARSEEAETALHSPDLHLTVRK